MLTKTSTPVNLLDMMQELELLEVTMLVDGDWLKLDDRASLYRAAIVALMECAESEGFNVLSTALCERIRPTEIEIEETEDDYEREECEPCEGSGGNLDGTPCEACKGFGDTIIG
jgi:hypothetical protein